MNKDVIYIHIYHGILLSHKEDNLMPFVKVWMDIDGIILSETSQIDKEKY